MPPKRRGRAAAQSTSRTRATATKPTKPTKSTKPARTQPTTQVTEPKKSTPATSTTNGNKRRLSPAAKPLPQAKKPRTSPVSKPKKSSQSKRKTIVDPIYDEVWREVYLAGTEWEQLQLVYSIDWDFDHLDDALTDGDLKGKLVHLFGATEPQLVKQNEKDEKGDVVPIPTIVAVVSDKPPPSVVGLDSVQRAEEEIVEMSKLRMGWHAYAPANVSHRRAFKPLVHILKCNERRARLRNMDEASVHKYDYVLPHIIKPDHLEKFEEQTNVDILVDLEGRPAPLMCQFDYDEEDFDEFIEETIEDNELDTKKHKEPLKKAVSEAVEKAKQKNKNEKEKRKKQLQAMTPEEKESIKNMKLIKFYPSNEWPDISQCKSRYINRYYGQATEIRDKHEESDE